MSDLSHRSRTLLHLAAPEYEPDRRDRDRIHRRLLRGIAIGVAAGAAATLEVKSAAAVVSSKAAAPALVAATTSSKIAVAVAVVATLGGGAALGTSFVERRSETPKRPVTTSAPSHVAATAMALPPPATPTIAAASTTQDRAPSTPATLSGKAHAPATTVETDLSHGDVVSPEPTAAVSADIAEELALIRAAQDALRGGSGHRALARLDEHARRFPNGALAEERDTARVLALSQLGRATDACVEAAHFVEAHPLSPHASTVREACAASSRGH